MNLVLVFANTATNGNGIAESFGINIYDFISQAICFLILAYILNRFLFKPVLKIVDQRRIEAEEAAKNAQMIKNELKETKEARQQVLSKAHEQAEKIISETKAAAAELREQEKRRIEEMTAQMIAQARAEAVMNQKKLKNELKGEIADMIVRLTGIIAEKNLSEADRKKIFESAMAELSKTTTEH